VKSVVKSVVLSTDALNRKVRELIRNTELNADDVMRNEARLLVEELVKRTKPKSRSKLAARIIRDYDFAFSILPQMGERLNNPRYAQLSSKYKRQTAKIRYLQQRLADKGNVLKAAIGLAQDHIGYFAAGWLGKGNPLAASRGIPAFVKKQDIEGTVIEAKKSGGVQWTGNNASSFIRHLPLILGAEYRVMAAALETRKTKIGLNLKRIMSGKAKYRIPTK
jgi:hypothetical protein